MLSKCVRKSEYGRRCAIVVGDDEYARVNDNELSFRLKTKSEVEHEMKHFGNSIYLDSDNDFEPSFTLKTRSEIENEFKFITEEDNPFSESSTFAKSGYTKKTRLGNCRNG